MVLKKIYVLVLFFLSVFLFFLVLYWTFFVLQATKGYYKILKATTGYRRLLEVNTGYYRSLWYIIGYYFFSLKTIVSFLDIDATWIFLVSTQWYWFAMTRSWLDHLVPDRKILGLRSLLHSEPYSGLSKWTKWSFDQFIKMKSFISFSI